MKVKTRFWDLVGHSQRLERHRMLAVAFAGIFAVRVVTPAMAQELAGDSGPQRQTSARQAQSADDEVRKTRVLQLPVGAFVEVRLLNGKKVQGRLDELAEGGFMLRAVIKNHLTELARHSPDIESGTIRRWLRFNLVGAIGVAVQVGMLGVFSRIFGLGGPLSTALAVEASLLHNFIWHERFTWPPCPSRSRKATDRFALGPPLRRLLSFNLTNGAVSVAGNLALVWLLTGPAHLRLLAANLLAIACCGLLNFVISDRVVFRPEA